MIRVIYFVSKNTRMRAVEVESKIWDRQTDRHMQEVRGSASKNKLLHNESDLMLIKGTLSTTVTFTPNKAS